MIEIVNKEDFERVFNELRSNAFCIMQEDCTCVRNLFEDGKAHVAIGAMRDAESVIDAFFQIGLISGDEKHERNLLIQDEYLRSLGLDRDWLNSEYEPSICDEWE